MTIVMSSIASLISDIKYAAEMNISIDSMGDPLDPLDVISYSLSDAGVIEIIEVLEKHLDKLSGLKEQIENESR